MTQGHDLNELLLSKGKSFTEVGINPATVWRLMQAGHKFQARTVRTLAKKLGVRTETVLAAILESQRRAHGNTPKIPAAQIIPSPTAALPGAA